MVDRGVGDAGLGCNFHHDQVFVALLGQHRPGSGEDGFNSLKRSLLLRSTLCSCCYSGANEGDFFKKLIIPTHPEIDEVWSRVKVPEAMIGMLNWDRGNPMAAPWRCVKVEDTSHWMMLDQPQQVNTALLEWLSVG